MPSRPKSSSRASQPESASQPTKRVKTFVESSTDDRVLTKQFKSRKNTDYSQVENGTFNKGTFSTSERDAIDRAIGSYCSEKSIPKDDVHWLVHKRSATLDENSNPYAKKEYASFVPDVIQESGVNRSCDQVYFYLARAYSIYRPERRAWSEEEDAKLKKLVLTKGRKWAEIERDMNRTDCRNRYNRVIGLTSNSALSKMGKWTDDEITRLVDAIKSVMAEHEITSVSKFNLWGPVASLVVSRNETQCRQKWRDDLSMKFDGQEFGTAPIWSFEMDAQLLTRLIVNCESARDITEVIWDGLVEEGEVWNGSYLKTRWNRLYSKIPNVETLSFQESIQYALTHLEDLSRFKTAGDTPLTVLSEDVIIESDDESDQDSDEDSDVEN